MKVLLKEDVDNLGYAGEVMTVADGYGRNFLIPRGLAVKASPNVLRSAHQWRQRAVIRMAELQKEHEALSARLVDTRLLFVARAGETGKLYGSVTTADVVEKLNDQLGTEVERRQIIGGPLRQLGEHKVTVRLSRDYQPQITVAIEPFEEEAPEEEDAVAEADMAVDEMDADVEVEFAEEEELDFAEEEDEQAEEELDAAEGD